MTPIIDLAARARALVQAASGRRVVLGMAGPPGAGKTTLTHALLDELRANPPEGATGAEWVSHVPMDGFHLADVQLDRLGLRARKGAPETFDALGYAATLQRIVDAPAGATIYAPGFERTLEQPIAAAVAVTPEARLVVTEGNYLLLGDDPWPQVRAVMAEVWYVQIDQSTRIERLVQRHVDFGKSPEEARKWVLRSDEANALVVSQARDHADLVITA